MNSACRLILAVALSATAAGWARPVAAQSPLFPKPWRPAPGDSLSLWAAEARKLLHASKNDALGDNEKRAYLLVDRVARAYFRSLGPKGMASARGITALLDSLRIPSKITQDPEYPAFTLVQYFNPEFENYASLAYLYWFRGDEIRSQPVFLRGGKDASLRVYWTDREDGPWEAGILYYQGEGLTRDPELILLRMVRTGAGWMPVQAGVASLDLGSHGTAEWTDLDRDGTPEIVSWTEGSQDSLFVPCREVDCPKVLTERTFVPTPSGYQLYDQRSVATPYATLILFLRALSRGDEAFAQTLVSQREVMPKVRELGWVGLRRARSFRYQVAPGMPRWPNRLRFEYGRPGAYDQLVEVRFEIIQGHWLIQEVLVLRQIEGAAGVRSGAAPAATPRETPRPAAKGRGR